MLQSCQKFSSYNRENYVWKTEIITKFAFPKTDRNKNRDKTAGNSLQMTY